MLNEPGAITDLEVLGAVSARLGALPVGMHYSPVVSPLVGGSVAPENFEIETARVHLRTAIATYRAISG